MEIEKRLQKHTKGKSQDLPWPYGFDPLSASRKAAAVWKLLEEEEKLIISKHSPYQVAQTEKIRQLREIGLEFPILAELTGYCLSHVKRIVYGPKRYDIPKRKRAC